ncbi:MAG: phosphoribosylglycinamide formyltransferase [Candidatus Omnitrophica bacterium]|nr:phosphoribosylglycinamide formyltransferase [Candidatus Omnitrophota bacterium]MDD5671878.1 phosphoribosylglycinamide formyltransferase [Candidatus Omnitrophota bacterium]
MKKLAIFVSGSGTNMENIIKTVHAGKIPVEAALVVCDKPDAPAITKAQRLGVEVALVDRKKYTSKTDFEAEIIRRVEAKKIDLIALAGFMRVLSPEFVNHFKGRVINIHPSLLPAFPGAHGIRDAFEAKVKETGVTVHYVIAEVDAGPVILQRKVAILPEDTLATLEAKIHAVEYQLYPEALRVVSSINPPLM